MSSEEAFSSYRWIILAVLWIGTFFMSGTWLFIISIIDEIGFGIFNIGLTTGEGALIVILPFVSLIPLSFLSGPIVDRIGVKKIGIIGSVIFALFASLRGISDSFFTLAIYSIIMGAGIGLSMPLGSKLIGYWFKESEIGTANGISVMASGFGIFFFEAITLPIILPLVGHNWRNTFFFYGILLVISTIFWILFIKDYPEEQAGEKTFERAPIREALSSIIRNKEVWFVGIVATALNLSYFVGKNAYRLLFPLRTGESSFFHNLFGKPEIAVLLISIISLGAMFSNIIIPFLSDRMKNRKIFITIGLSVMGVLIVLTGMVTGIILWVFAFIIGFTVGMVAPLTPTCIIEIVEAKYIGTAAGLTNSLGYASVLTLSMLFPYLIPDKSNPILYLPLLIALGILCYVGVLFIQKLPETAGKMRRVH